MQQDREVRADADPLFLARGLPGDGGEAVFGGATLWLTGGASLLLWTAIALLLTTA